MRKRSWPNWMQYWETATGGGRGARSRRGIGGAIGKKGISGSKKAGSRSNKRLVTESERKTHRNQELKNTSPPRQKMADCFKKPK